MPLDGFQCKICGCIRLVIPAVSAYNVVTYVIYYFSKFMRFNIKIIIDPVNNYIKARRDWVWFGIKYFEVFESFFENLFFNVLKQCKLIMVMKILNKGGSGGMGMESLKAMLKDLNLYDLRILARKSEKNIKLCYLVVHGLWLTNIIRYHKIYYTESGMKSYKK